MDGRIQPINRLVDLGQLLQRLNALPQRLSTAGRFIRTAWAAWRSVRVGRRGRVIRLLWRLWRKKGSAAWLHVGLTNYKHNGFSDIQRLHRCVSRTMTPDGPVTGHTYIFGDANIPGSRANLAKRGVL
jgi:hypothetical protein